MLVTIGPRIVTVRLAELAADHVLQASGSGRSMDGNGGTALVSPEYDAEKTRAVGGFARKGARYGGRDGTGRCSCRPAPSPPGRSTSPARSEPNCPDLFQSSDCRRNTKGEAMIFSGFHIRSGWFRFIGRTFHGSAQGKERNARIGLAVMVLLALLWLLAASRVHVNASWSDSAWGYFVLPMLQRPRSTATWWFSSLRFRSPGFRGYSTSRTFSAFPACGCRWIRTESSRSVMHVATEQGQNRRRWTAGH